jgi:hypothetical protein
MELKLDGKKRKHSSVQQGLKAEPQRKSQRMNRYEGSYAVDYPTTDGKSKKPTSVVKEPLNDEDGHLVIKDGTNLSSRCN